KIRSTRRGVLARGAAFVGAAALAGCDKVINTRQAASAFQGVDLLNRKAQELILHAQQLAPEYTEADISPRFYANGTTDPDDDAYRALAADGFKDYRLGVGGVGGGGCRR